ncbi:4Fe-4S dicluster domain-containing protein [Ramlibacter sp. G-1-2-2]|uniref:4Fe-4S dicluster domain-containing protein n=1 Tax=Ramlibacter agri TaxID=2728837 RepID=A0A848H2N0_9BURK|nr:4Fe-4S dicluster domain-containing protein [Ramlibacter agri]NML43962.1 4Fe-4S dicluster domain-containing protein [Ramlibacter agri]
MEQPLQFVPKVNRRRALGLMAASLALGGTGCSRPPRETIYPWVHMPEARAAGLPLFYASACLRDGHGLGVLVGTEGGRPIKIEGSPAHPSSLGATDAWMQASVLELWDPDRSGEVLQRTAPGGPLAASSWSAFETAWSGMAQRLQARSGEGLHLLTGPLTSPTVRFQIDALLKRWPKARWTQYAPLHDEAAEQGAQLAFGQPVQALRHVDRARCIVALGSDPFTEGPGALRQALDWSNQRRAGAQQAARLFAVEATPGLFGARADQRLALPPAQIDALVQRLATALAGGAAPTAGFEAALLQALRAAGPGSLLVPGACLSPASHALVHGMHQQLASRCVDVLAPMAMAPESGRMPALLDAMQAGAVDTLLVLDANPCYASPSFAAALGRVPASIHLGLYTDETARSSTWHLPLSHAYEQWGDALAHDGTVTLLQPAIAPLYDTRSLAEVLALAGGGDVRDGHALVQAHWRPFWNADFEARWREALQLGCVESTPAHPLKLRSKGMGELLAATPPEAPALVALFSADPSVADGRYANNGWLQELPRPFTKLTWDNALLIGPATAASYRLSTGDRVRATTAQGHVDAPVWVLPGQAEGVMTVPLGYGRTAAGHVGNGVGFDGYVLRAKGEATAPLQLQKLADRHDFSVTQHEMDQHGRDLARTVLPTDRIVEPGHASLYPERPKSEGAAWAMTIDLDACIGCNACTAACQAENNIPVVGREEVARGHAMHWIRVDHYRTEEVAGSIFQPVPCMHCEDAPCELVCPVGATMHDTEGLNVQVYNRCIGTRFCSNNCPYKVRRFNFLQYSDDQHESLKGQRNPNVTVRSRGVMEKCSYCLQRVARARQHEQTTGLPAAAVVTACQAACPTRAISFGDLNDKDSTVVKQRESPRHYALLGELNTRPRTTYLARVRREEK